MKLAVMWKHIWPGNCALLFYLSAVLLPFLFAPKAHTTVLYNKRRPISASYLSSLRALCIWAKSTQVRWCRVVLTNDSMCRQACYWTRYQPYKELNSKWEWECYNSKWVLHFSSYSLHWCSGLQNQRPFLWRCCKVLVSSSIFNPASLPAEELALPKYGKKEVQALVDFYGKEVTIEFEGETYTSPPLVDSEEIFAEWRMFKRAIETEKEAIMEKRKFKMEISIAYKDVFLIQ